MPVLQLFKDLIESDTFFDVEYDSVNRAFYITEFGADKNCTTLNTWSFVDVDHVEYSECMALLAKWFD